MSNPRGRSVESTKSRTGLKSRAGSRSGEFGGKKHMQRLSFLLLVCAAIIVTSGCATHKFVRNQVKTSSDTLTARIETNEGQIKEVQDEADKKVSGVETKVSGVETKVSELDTKTSEQINSVKTDVQGVDQKASQAHNEAQHAAAGVST